MRLYILFRLLTPRGERHCETGLLHVNLSVSFFSITTNRQLHECGQQIFQMSLENIVVCINAYHVIDYKGNFVGLFQNVETYKALVTYNYFRCIHPHDIDTVHSFAQGKRTLRREIMHIKSTAVLRLNHFTINSTTHTAPDQLKRIIPCYHRVALCLYTFESTFHKGPSGTIRNQLHIMCLYQNNYYCDPGDS